MFFFRKAVWKRLALFSPTVRFNHVRFHWV